MKEQLKRRQGLLVFLGVALLGLALFSLGPSTWATPAQDAEHGEVTVPPIKTIDKHLVKVGDVAVYEIKLTNPATPPWTWENVVVTDTIDSRLWVYSIMTTQGSFSVVGQDVTVNIGDMLPGTSNTIAIHVDVEDGNPGDLINNMAYVPRPGLPPLESTEATTTIGFPIFLPVIMKDYIPPLNIRVIQSTDDAEEDNATGYVYITSTDLELVQDGTTNQTVGIRFQNIRIPPGATILSAYVQFQVEDESTGPASLTIRGEGSDNSGVFVSSRHDITSRPATAAFVDWTPAPWSTIGEAGPDQQTPDIKSIVQEIVSRVGWQKGNALSIFITGSGTRTAESYDGMPGAAPLLHVQYLTSPA